MKEALNKRAKLFGRSTNSLHPQCKCRHLPIARIIMAFLPPLVLGMRPTHRTKPDPTGSDGLSSASHPPFPLKPLPALLLLSQRDRERCLHSPPGHSLSCLRLTPTYTEAQAPVSSSQAEYPTTSENHHIPHPRWTVAHQAPLSMEFSRKKYWSGLPFPSQGIFPTQRLNPGVLHCRQIFYH